jgi:tRNA (cytidine/uridine-2'-O-)-methyltransferase
MLKRSALDYFEKVKIVEIDDLLIFLKKSKKSFYFFSSKANKKYSEVSYKEGDLLIFGSETTGLPSIFREKWEKNFATIPMKSDSRCLNLSNAVSIVLYEALRQLDFSFEKII